MQVSSLELRRRSPLPGRQQPLYTLIFKCDLKGRCTTQDAVQNAWQANLRVNEVLLEHLTRELLDARTPGGGYSVAIHLAHIVGTTKYFGSKLDKNLRKLPNLFTIREDLGEDDP